MIDNTEAMAGYRIRWLSSETPSAVDTALRAGDYDGIGFNPYDGIGLDAHKGWTGNINEFFSMQLPLKALALPFADRVGFTSKLIEHQQQQLEMLLLSEFTGNVHIESRSLKVLRLLVMPDITLGSLPMLQTLYLRESTKDLLCELGVKASGLTALELNGGSIESIEGVGALADLVRVELSNLKKLKTISPLSHCSKLEVLVIQSVRGLTNLEETLKTLKSLRVLRIIDCGKLDGFDFLDGLKLKEFRCNRTKVSSRKHPALARIETVFVG